MSDYMEPREEIEISNTEAACRFCGQIHMLHGFAGTERQAEDHAVMMCDCEGAKIYQEQIRQTELALGSLDQLFGQNSEKPVTEETMDMLKLSVKIIGAKQVQSVTMDAGRGMKAKISRTSKGKIKVERTIQMKKTQEIE